MVQTHSPSITHGPKSWSNHPKLMVQTHGPSKTQCPNSLPIKNSWSKLMVHPKLMVQTRCPSKSRGPSKSGGPKLVEKLTVHPKLIVQTRGPSKSRSPKLGSFYKRGKTESHQSVLCKRRPLRNKIQQIFQNYHTCILPASTPVPSSLLSCNITSDAGRDVFCSRRSSRMRTRNRHGAPNHWAVSGRTRADKNLTYTGGILSPEARLFRIGLETALPRHHLQSCSLHNINGDGKRRHARRRSSFHRSNARRQQYRTPCPRMLSDNDDD